MATSQESRHTSDDKKGWPHPRPSILTLAEPRSAYTLVKRQDARKQRFRAILKGAGSLVALMPSPPLKIQRGKIGSFAETSRRVRQIWRKSFQAAKE